MPAITSCYRTESVLVHFNRIMYSGNDFSLTAILFSFLMQGNNSLREVKQGQVGHS